MSNVDTVSGGHSAGVTLLIALAVTEFACKSLSFPRLGSPLREGTV